MKKLVIILCSGTAKTRVYCEDGCRIAQNSQKAAILMFFLRGKSTGIGAIWDTNLVR